MKSKFLEMYNLIMEEILKEATGLTHRTTGEVFISKSNPENKIQFQKLQYIDSNQFYSFIEQNNIQIIDPKNEISEQIGIYNKNLRNLIPDKIICLAIFKWNERLIGFAKYVKSNQQKWTQSGNKSSFKQMYGYIFGNKKGQSGNISPSDLVGNGQFSNQELYQKVKNSVLSNETISKYLKQYLILLMNFFTGKMQQFPISTAVIDSSDILYIVNVFGQILGALAILNNINILNSQSFYNEYKITSKNSKILYNLLKNDKLIDFKVINFETNQTIGVSSKADSGGKPSVTGLLDKVHSLNNESKNIYQKQIEIFQIINQNTMYLGPIKIIQNVLIYDKKFLNYFYETFHTNLTTEILTKINSIYSKKPSSFQGDLNLNKFALSGKIGQFNNFYNIIAGITKCVVHYLNANYKFEDLINLLLSQNFVQIHLYHKFNQNKMLNNIIFKIKSMKNQKYRISLNYGSNYQSDRCLGKIKFQIGAGKK